MKYINKNNGEIISETVYLQLSQSVQSFYIKMQDDNKNINHQIIEHKDDHATIGDALTVIAMTPLILMSKIF